MAHPTNNTVPTGGVKRPIPAFKIRTIPKWTGSIPKFVTTGRRIGVIIKIIGAMSIGAPRRSNKILIINKITSGLSEIFKNKSVTIPGICKYARIQPKAAEAAIKKKTMDTVLIVLIKIFQILDTGASL
jgi:hypothetical protein